MDTILKDYIEGQFRELGDEVAIEIDDDLVLLGFDSIAYVRLVAFIRDRFDVAVPDADVTVEQFGTVAAISAYLTARSVTEPTAGDHQ